jgi:glycosyltransferase involved in cell wall biosynthesis
MKAPVLWITPWFPHPPIDGARVASQSLLRSLSNLGEEIVVAALSPTEIEISSLQAFEQECGILRSTIIPISSKYSLNTLRYLWNAPFTYARFFTPKILTTLENLIVSMPWKAVVAEGLHTATIASRIVTSKTSLPFIYRAQNAESELWNQNSTFLSSIPLCFRPIIRPIVRFEAKRVAQLESSVCHLASKILTVSDVDAKILSKWCCDNCPPVTVPVGFSFPKPPKWEKDDTLRLLFIGRLDWPPNRDGLSWFLTEIWPYVLSTRQNIHLTIAGSGAGRWLNNYKTMHNIEILSHLKNVAPIYSKCHLAIVPVRFGSGVRVKTIEAAQFGRPCLSTTIGTMGIPLTHDYSALISDDTDEWRKLITTISVESLEELGQQAWTSLRDYCNDSRSATDCQKIINQISDHKIVSNLDKKDLSCVPSRGA